MRGAEDPFTSALGSAGVTLQEFRLVQLFARNFFLWLVLALTLAQGARASSPPALPQLPAFDGEFSGDFLMPTLQSGTGNGLTFHWHIIAESPAATPGVRRAHLDVTGHGAHVVALAELDLASGVTHWKIESAEADLAETYPVLASLWWPNSSFANLGIAGKLVVTGDGTVDTSGKWTANLAADIRDATLRNDAQGWLAEGVSARVEFPALPSLKTSAAQAQPVTVSRFTHSATQLVLNDVRTGFALDEAGADGAGGADGAVRIRLADTTARAVGGTIAVGAFDFAPSAPSLATTVHVRDIESGYLAALMPRTISEARGQFSGTVALTWNPTDGLRPGQGQLTLQQSPDTMLRLASTPGLFTSNMDRRLYFLPTSLGFLRNWISLKNPAYDTLKEIEEGRQPIIVNNITINFTPEGDEKGRSANVVIEARPTNQRSSIQHLRINVNVNGPLTKVIEMLSTDRVQISF